MTIVNYNTPSYLNPKGGFLAYSAFTTGTVVLAVFLILGKLLRGHYFLHLSLVDLALLLHNLHHGLGLLLRGALRFVGMLAAVALRLVKLALAHAWAASHKLALVCLIQLQQLLGLVVVEPIALHHAIGHLLHHLCPILVLASDPLVVLTLCIGSQHHAQRNYHHHQ